MKQSPDPNEKREGRMDVIKGIGWLLLPIAIGLLIYFLS
jgi:hypothetical protein